MSNDYVVIKRVWKWNFDEEMSIVKEKAMSDHPIVSLAVRPLLCTKRVPLGNGWGNSDANYLALLETVNKFKNVVQVGFALSDNMGRLPRGNETCWPCIWEFNLMPLEAEADQTGEKRFLKQFCGSVEVEKLRRDGIHPERFASELRDSGLLMKDQICWVVFKGGLDLMALVRSWNTRCLILEREEFLRLLAVYFPLFFDMAAVMGFHPELDDGSIDVCAGSIGVWREHQSPRGAASESLLALRLFVRMKMFKKGCELLGKKARVLFGLSSEQEANAVPTFTMAPF